MTDSPVNSAFAGEAEIFCSITHYPSWRRRYGAKIAIAAKTDTPNAKLPGTIHTAAAKIEQAGGRALALTGDGERHQSEVGLKAKA